MTAIFITGTGTDVGKTFVVTGLIRHLRATGQPSPPSSRWSRLRRRRHGGSTPQSSGELGFSPAPPINRISPFPSHAISPDMAARRRALISTPWLRLPPRIIATSACADQKASAASWCRSARIARSTGWRARPPRSWCGQLSRQPQPHADLSRGAPAPRLPSRRWWSTTAARPCARRHRPDDGAVAAPPPW